MRLDWSTLALQTVNVLVLLWLLRRFLFRPVVEIIDKRRAAIEGTLADAAQAGAQADARVAEIARREEGMAAEAARIRAEAHEAAGAEKAAMLQQAAAAAEQIRARSEKAAREAQAGMKRELEGQAAELALAIAARLLGGLPAAKATSALVSSFEASLRDLPRELLAGISDPTAVLDVTTAVALGSAEQAGIRAGLEDVLGHKPTLRFSADPSLIAGIELRGPHCVIHNSWRADLDRIVSELKLDSRDVEPALA